MTYQAAIENGQPVPVDPAPLPNEDAAEMALEADFRADFEDMLGKALLFECLAAVYDKTRKADGIGIMAGILITTHRGGTMKEVERYLRLKPRCLVRREETLRSILDEIRGYIATQKTTWQKLRYSMEDTQNQNDPQPAKEGRLFVPTGKPVTITAEQAKELVHAIEDALVEEREAQAAALEKAVAAIEKAKAANEKLIAIRERNIEVMEILEAVLIDLNAGTLDNDRLKATLLETVKILGNIYRE